MIAALTWQNGAAEPNIERGEALYENHCRECHESNVHIRQRTRVRTLVDLRAQVTRWAGEVKLGWGFEEITDVAGYLNGRYYHFPAE
ncbi:MAG: hypothetical protein Kow006_04240 [Gammaproteobacteria bacterium]